jgi:hypothetical protein
VAIALAKITGGALVVALFSAGASKWLLGHPPQAVIPLEIARAVGVVEMFASVLFVMRPFRQAVCAMVICICLAGIAIHFAFPGRPCGCLGPISPGWHLSMTGLLGALAATHLTTITTRSQGITRPST